MTLGNFDAPQSARYALRWMMLCASGALAFFGMGTPVYSGQDAYSMAEHELKESGPTATLQKMLPTAPDVSFATSTVAAALDSSADAVSIDRTMRAALSFAKSEHRWAISSSLAAAGGYNPHRVALFAAMAVGAADDKTETACAVAPVVPESTRPFFVRLCMDYRGCDPVVVSRALEAASNFIGDDFMLKAVFE